MVTTAMHRRPRIARPPRLVRLGLLAAIAVMAAACAGPAGSATPPAGGQTSPPGQTRTSAGQASAAGSAIEGVTIRYVKSSQAELILPSGRHIFIDVGYADVLGSQPAKNDMLLISQGRPHHYDEAFAASFPGQKLVMQPGEITLDDVSVRTVESSDSETPFEPGEGNNQMFVIETAGVRILHCGDLDQSSMTSAQLAALGTIDVAICPVKDPNQDDPTGLNAINLLGQINPRVVIPTDVDMPTAKSAAARWMPSYTTKPAVTLLRRQIPAETALLFLGSQAENYGKILGLSESSNW